MGLLHGVWASAALAVAIAGILLGLTQHLHDPHAAPVVALQPLVRRTQAAILILQRVASGPHTPKKKKNRKKLPSVSSFHSKMFIKVPFKRERERDERKERNFSPTFIFAFGV
jgi:hypothetical protein